MESRSRQARSLVPRNLLQSAIAVVVGNAIYFLSMNHLPRAARHGVNRLDLGLVVDFWICLVIYGLLELLKRWRRGRHPQ
jgi:hypothetical protein